VVACVNELSPPWVQADAADAAEKAGRAAADGPPLNGDTRSSHA